MDTSSEQPPRGKEAQLLPPPKILIIDHNEAFQKLTEIELRKFMVSDNITKASSIWEANNVLLEAREKRVFFDVIISAFRFPGQRETGIDFAMRVKDGIYGNRPFFVIRTSNLDEIESEFTKDQLTACGVHDAWSRELLSKRKAEELKNKEFTQALRNIR